MSVNVHESRLQEYVDRGMVVVEHRPPRVEIVDPERTCLHPMMSGRCLLDKGHRSKRHSTVVFYCDACGRTLRGAPHATQRDVNGDVDVVFCFGCSTGKF